MGVNKIAKKTSPHSLKSKKKMAPLIRNLPSDPLPRCCIKWPLDSKFPMTTGRKDIVVFHRAKIAKSLVHHEKVRMGFKMHTPDGYPGEYEPLHDPHLKKHVHGRILKRKLRRSGLITCDDFVRCSLKEFNSYRRYLNSVYLFYEKFGMLWEQRQSMRLRNLMIQDQGRTQRRQHIRHMKSLQAVRRRAQKNIERTRNATLKLMSEKDVRAKTVLLQKRKEVAEKTRKLKAHFELRVAVAQHKLQENQLLLKKQVELNLNREKKFDTLRQVKVPKTRHKGKQREQLQDSLEPVNEIDPNLQHCQQFITPNFQAKVSRECITHEMRQNALLNEGQEVENSRRFMFINSAMTKVVRRRFRGRQKSITQAQAHNEEPQTNLAIRSVGKRRKPKSKKGASKRIVKDSEDSILQPALEKRLAVSDIETTEITTLTGFEPEEYVQSKGVKIQGKNINSSEIPTADVLPEGVDSNISTTEVFYNTELSSERVKSTPIIADDLVNPVILNTKESGKHSIAKNTEVENLQNVNSASSTESSETEVRCISSSSKLKQENTTSHSSSSESESAKSGTSPTEVSRKNGGSRTSSEGDFKKESKNRNADLAKLKKKGVRSEVSNRSSAKEIPHSIVSKSRTFPQGRIQKTTASTPCLSDARLQSSSSLQYRQSSWNISQKLIEDFGRSAERDPDVVIQTSRSESSTSGYVSCLSDLIAEILQESKCSLDNEGSHEIENEMDKNAALRALTKPPNANETFVEQKDTFMESSTSVDSVIVSDLVDELIEKTSSATVTVNHIAISPNDLNQNSDESLSDIPILAKSSVLSDIVGEVIRNTSAELLLQVKRSDITNQGPADTETDLTEETAKQLVTDVLREALSKVNAGVSKRSSNTVVATCHMSDTAVFKPATMEVGRAKGRAESEISARTTSTRETHDLKPISVRKKVSQALDNVATKLTRKNLLQACAHWIKKKASRCCCCCTGSRKCGSKKSVDKEESPPVNNEAVSSSDSSRVTINEQKISPSRQTPSNYTLVTSSSSAESTPGVRVIRPQTRKKQVDRRKGHTRDSQQVGSQRTQVSGDKTLNDAGVITKKLSPVRKCDESKLTRTNTDSCNESISPRSTSSTGSFSSDTDDRAHVDE